MTDSVLHLFLATELDVVDHDRHGPEEEYMDILHLPLETALEMVDRGEIRDAKTIIGLLMVDRRLARGDLGPTPATTTAPAAPLAATTEG